MRGSCTGAHVAVFSIANACAQCALVDVVSAHAVSVQMDESREAASAGGASGLLTLAEVPAFVTHDAANEGHNAVSTLSSCPVCHMELALHKTF